MAGQIHSCFKTEIYIRKRNTQYLHFSINFLRNPHTSCVKKPCCDHVSQHGNRGGDDIQLRTRYLSSDDGDRADPADDCRSFDTTTSSKPIPIHLSSPPPSQAKREICEVRGHRKSFLPDKAPEKTHSSFFTAIKAQRVVMVCVLDKVWKNLGRIDFTYAML